MQGKPAQASKPFAVKFTVGSGFMCPWGLREWPNGVSSFFGREHSQLGVQDKPWEGEGACCPEGLGRGEWNSWATGFPWPDWTPAAAAAGLKNICRELRRDQKSKLGRRRQQACMHGLCKRVGLNQCCRKSPEQHSSAGLAFVPPHGPLDTPSLVHSGW